MKVKERRRRRFIAVLKKAVAKTIRIKRENFSVFWKNPRQAVHEINRMADAGRPFHDSKGYYYNAELTDIGEVWVKFISFEEAEKLH